MIYKQLVNGKFISSGKVLPIHNPWNGKLVAEVGIADESQVGEALNAASLAKKQFKRTPRFMRSRILSYMLESLRDRKKQIVDTIVAESGKPISLAEVEFSRCISTFETAVYEALQFCGEIYPMDIDPGGSNFSTSKIEYFPKGVILAITPFNFPLNLVAHKIAPAIAVGAPIIVKPSPQSPGSAFILGEIFLEALEKTNQEQSQSSDSHPEGVIPPAALQVLFMDNESAEKTCGDNRISIVSFTGSAKVGWKLQEIGNKKNVLLELGGNASVIVSKSADIPLAVKRSAYGATAYSGQSCISVQRIFIEESIYSEFKSRLIEEFRQIKTGDPLDGETINGPMIDLKSQERVLDWINEAINSGGKLVVGGSKQGKCIMPTILEDVPKHCKVFQEEVFGPVAIIEKTQDFEEAIKKTNESKYGIHAGVFTNDINLANYAFMELEVGGVIINEVPTFRADHMPYGGVKESGIGREGVRYAMKDYCEMKTLVTKFNR